MRLSFLALFIFSLGCSDSGKTGADESRTSKLSVSQTVASEPAASSLDRTEPPKAKEGVGPAQRNHSDPTSRRKKRIVLPSQMTPEETARLEAHQAVLRARHYENQRALRIPGEVLTAMIGVVPQSVNHKATGYEVHHDMELVRLKPGRYFLKYRWVTLMRGPELRKALRASLSSAGWVLNDMFFDRGDSVHPDRGRLRIELIEPAERATMVTATIEQYNSSQDVSDPTGRLSFPIPWVSVISEPVLGYEMSHFRDVHPGASFTDIERLAIGYRPADRERFKSDIRTAAREAGFVGRGRASQKLVSPNGSSVLPLDTDPDYVVVHTMRQYGHPRSKPKADDSKR